MDRDRDNAVKIGILETHVTAIHTRLDRQEEKIDERFDKQDEKLDSILEYMNKSKGAMAFLMLVAGAIGAAFMKAIGLMFGAVTKI